MARTEVATSGGDIDYYGDDLTTTVTYKSTFDQGPRAQKCTGPRWNTTTPRCKAFECKVPTLNNGKWNTNKTHIKHGDGISITCDPGYSSRGSPSMLCDIADADENDGLKIEPPTCHVTECARPEHPENGYYSYTSKNRHGWNKVGSIIVLSCNSNYQLYGSKTRTCGETGRWSGGGTTCQPKRARDISDCPVPVIPFGGRKLGKSYNSGDEVIFRCFAGYLPRGAMNLTCDGKTRQWSPPGSPNCEYVYSYDDLAGNIGDVLYNLKGKEVQDSRGRRINLDAPGGLDLTFLIDASGSITRTEFDHAIDFVKLFVKKVGVSGREDGARIAVATFSTNPKQNFDDNNGFHASQGINVAAITGLLTDLKYSKGETNINGVLKHYEDNMYPLNIATRENARQYLLLLSDGQYNAGGNPQATADRLKKTLGIEIFAIKIGSSRVKEDDIKHAKVLRQLSSEAEMNSKGEGDPHYFHIEKYGSLDYAVQKLLSANGVINYGVCGVPGKTGITSGNIIGGDIAKVGAWPWMVALMEAKAGTPDNPVQDLSQYKHACGGTLLNREWVLTAAHCMQGGSYNNTARIIVKIGVNNVKTQSEELDPLNVFDVRVSAMYFHGAWTLNANKEKGTDPNYAGDIALLRLAKKVTFSKMIRPICLAKKDQKIKDATGVVAGWGKFGNESVTDAEAAHLPKSEHLRQVQIPVVTPQEDGARCKVHAGEKIICAGAQGLVKDACKGDSGGPLMIPVQTADGVRWNQIGIVSNGVGCALQGPRATYGEYTDVRQYVDWIAQTCGNCLQIGQ